MPSDSGEKVTLGITSLLSTTVFLMLVADSMPPTSDALPLIGLYYGVTIFIVSLATALTVFTLNIHHTGFHGDPVPEVVQMIAFKYVAKFLFANLSTQKYLTTNFGGSRTSEPFVTGILQKRETAKKRVSFSHESVVSTPNGAFHATIERNEMRLAEKDRRNAAELEWQQVALVLDRFLLVVFVIGTLITSLTILCQRQLNFLLN
uniref:Neurotransmitter-gated ion-channel transmembrane domain-containing protein n=1 Tax=Panagrolaimus sp. PS1159 TaxID=55785 RepID=A0AC35EXM4_9BILA